MRLSATIFTNIHSAAKQGTAEELPDASCKIYGKSSGLIRCFFFIGIFQADKLLELKGRALVRQAVNLSSKKTAN